MSTKDIVLIALFAALTAALGLIPQIMLPVGVPITAQSLGVMLAGAVLGAKRGALAIVLFLGLVAVGLPLLSGGRGGIGVFFGPSGGFLFGFPIGAYVIGWLFERTGAKLSLFGSVVFLLIGGIGVVYLLGVPWLSYVAELPLSKALWGAGVYVPGDAIKVVLAALIAKQVRRSFPEL